MQTSEGGVWLDVQEEPENTSVFNMRDLKNDIGDASTGDLVHKMLGTIDNDLEG